MATDVAASVQRPWLGLYAADTPAELTPEFTDMLSLFRATVAARRTAPAIRYFDGTLTFGDLDERSTALAAHLIGDGFEAGDRLAVCTQNNPAFVVALLAAWKAGGAAVLINPMNKAGELEFLLVDSGACALLCLEEFWTTVAAAVVTEGRTSVRTVVTCSARDDQSRNDLRVLPEVPAPTESWLTPLRDIINGPVQTLATTVRPHAGSVAVLTYTSGTTGVPKGAMNTHGNVAFNAQVYRDWLGLTSGDPILGVAPLFHITGLAGHVALALLSGAPLVLAHRFEPHVVLEAIREHRPAFTIGSITVFIALTNLADVSRADWASFRVVCSGGAPISPAIAERFEAATGLYLHNMYGLTETTSPSHCVPRGQRAPVDPSTGALSVGIPVCNTVVRILGEDGVELRVGQVGEIATRGPQVIPGYWRKPDETSESLPGGELHTGDVGFMDEQGWFYLVDRKKDMINAAGYKVWPREVEDIIYGHELVREVAVVGVPDDYRGESVRAVVSLRPGAELTAEDLIAWCRTRMAAYKYPRSVVFVDEVPKTATGKVLRRLVRGS